METMLWIFLPGFFAIASAVLAWFIMQSRMEVGLALQREQLAESRGALSAEKTAIRDSVEIAVRAAEERAHRQALEGFLGELKVEQRHYTPENQLLFRSEKTAIRDSVEIAVRAAEERAHRQALEGFLGELKVEQRHYTRENKLLLHNRKCLVLQERTGGATTFAW